MRLDLMRPHQIRDAIARGLPVVLPLGVLEYHGEHLPSGMDTLAVTRVLDRLEAEMELVILPAFPYGAASFAVAGPEGTGTLQVDADVLAPFAQAVFAGLLRIGFRNIHAIVHHQTENFAAGMPTDLAFRLGARQAIFRHLEATRGEGWWGRADMSGYYADHAAGDDPFNWIKVHPLMDAEIIARYPFDHADEGETALMLALAPETVEMARTGENASWYTATAPRATAALGERGVALILERLRSLLRANPGA
jgi:creatinine amidohydrolase/Fe(II)-dependent formamide hydrolase-like protein